MKHEPTYQTVDEVLQQERLLQMGVLPPIDNDETPWEYAARCTADGYAIEATEAELDFND